MESNGSIFWGSYILKINSWQQGSDKVFRSGDMQVCGVEHQRLQTSQTNSIESQSYNSTEIATASTCDNVESSGNEQSATTDRVMSDAHGGTQSGVKNVAFEDSGKNILGDIHTNTLKPQPMYTSQDDRDYSRGMHNDHTTAARSHESINNPISPNVWFTLFQEINRVDNSSVSRIE